MALVRVQNGSLELLKGQHIISVYVILSHQLLDLLLVNVIPAILFESVLQFFGRYLVVTVSKGFKDRAHHGWRYEVLHRHGSCKELSVADRSIARVVYLI